MSSLGAVCESLGCCSTVGCGPAKPPDDLLSMCQACVTWAQRWLRLLCPLVGNLSSSFSLYPTMYTHKEASSPKGTGRSRVGRQLSKPSPSCSHGWR